MALRWLALFLSLIKKRSQSHTTSPCTRAASHQPPLAPPCFAARRFVIILGQKRSRMSGFGKFISSTARYLSGFLKTPLSSCVRLTSHRNPMFLFYA
ncbi:hypothetical protein F4818DRAFT_37569 [Hypoxylon cercidicola]|nr:hypothetical protein F4818DRAFT_37569 [Hypoxylon cercidicola]